ncbi:MAG: thioredoxin-disulfide reductase [Atopostipes suicloacalis]|nr:thioredoxin-disulfide reductase [Atopostipes suicloacalis]MDN6730908.1 thioredoxin-disulfide reductase [Atopostipes suicloacalis]
MEKETQDKIYDVVVIGAGPGGMTAALYASRSDLDTLILEKGVPGGQLMNTAEIENYSGFQSIEGPDLATNMYEGATAFGAEYSLGDVQEIIDGPDFKKIVTSDKIYQTRTIIIATGAEHRKLGIPGEDKLRGRGVSYCAVCDGAFFRNRPLVVVGGGDSAVEEGAYLTQFASDVTIIHRRDELRAQKILQDRAFENDKVNFIWDTVVEEIQGDNKVESLRLRNVKTDEVTDLSTEGTFIYVGLIPNTEGLEHLGITDEEGWILTDEYMQTAIPGIYAIGDVRQTVLRQVATAVGDGSIAGDQVYKYIESFKAQAVK